MLEIKNPEKISALFLRNSILPRSYFLSEEKERLNINLKKRIKSSSNKGKHPINFPLKKMKNKLEKNILFEPKDDAVCCFENNIR